MSVDPACPQSLPCLEASDSKESSPMPVICGPEENYPSLQMSSAEMPHTETVSPLPSSMDLLIQDSPDSSTSPKGKQPTAAENSATKKEDKVPVKKQKARTVFSSAQLCVLNDRFQRQKYLSLQQMQELSNILNLSYKQSWNNQAWNSPFSNCGEESLQSCLQFQPNSPASDLEAALEAAGEGLNVIQQTTRYLSTPQTVDLLLNYSTNMQPEDV
nr:homeobox protein NANOG [Macaca nemestrina]